MINMNQYKEAYKVCSEGIDDPKVLAKINDASVEDFISKKENWLSFPVEGEISIKDIIDNARSNIYLTIEGDRFTMGLTLNQMNAVKWFFDIMEEYSDQTMKELIAALGNLPEGYYTEVKRKIKDYHPQQSPKYTTEKRYQSNTITEKDFKEMVILAKKIREEGTQRRKERAPKFYRETPEIQVAAVEMLHTKENLKSATEKLFPILALCLSITPKKKASLEKLREELKKDAMLQSFQSDKSEYYNQYIKSRYPEIGFGAFVKIFNEVLNEE